MRRALLFSSVFVLFLICPSSAQPCEEKVSGRNGECMQLRNCREKFNIYTKTGAVPQVCNPELLTICCPERIRPTRTTTTTTERPSNRTSARKCQEYAKHLIIEETLINAHGQSFTKTIDACGHSVHTLFNYKDADEKEFPHMALIGYSSEKNEKFRCGGALISEQWVLSSVECSTDEELGDAKFIQLGGIKRKGAYEKSAQVFNIKRIVIHRHHSPLNIEHEIALYEMNEPATLSTYILPICLPQSDTIPIKIGTATGWNKMGLENKMSSVLKKINLNYFPMAKCEQYEDTDYRDYSTLHIDYPRMICAGTNSSCQSDPGSILQYCSEEVYCMYTITGVRARTNCTTDGVALYTKVFKYLDWIESFVWPNE